MRMVAIFFWILCCTHRCSLSVASLNSFGSHCLYEKLRRLGSSLQHRSSPVRDCQAGIREVHCIEGDINCLQTKPKRVYQEWCLPDASPSGCYVHVPAPSKKWHPRHLQSASGLGAWFVLYKNQSMSFYEFLYFITRNMAEKACQGLSIYPQFLNLWLGARRWYMPKG